MRLYAGNLPYKLTEDDLRNAFSEYGKVDTATVIMDKRTGSSKGFGFVEMPDKGDAEKAIKELNGRELDGRAIVVNEARPKVDRDDGPSRG